MNTTSLMKYREDIRPVTAVISALSLSLIPFIFPLDFAILFFLWPVLIYYRSYAPYSQHNHAHVPVFNSRFLNAIYDTLLTQTTGYPCAFWELHHNRGHHRHYLTPEKDVARVTDPKTGNLMSRWWYALRGNLTIFQDCLAIDREEREAGRKSLRLKLMREIALQACITTLLVLWNWQIALAFVIIPNAIMSWCIWWESYPHHLDTPGHDHYDSSVTIVGDKFNKHTFNIGHHAAHHEKPGLHWSLLPQRTVAIADRLDESTVVAKH